MVLHIMLLMQYVSKILIFLYPERMLHCMAKAPISQQQQDTVISIQNLIPKIITTFLLLKFWLEDMQWQVMLVILLKFYFYHLHRRACLKIRVLLNKASMLLQNMFSILTDPFKHSSKYFINICIFFLKKTILEFYFVPYNIQYAHIIEGSLTNKQSLLASLQ